MADNHANDFERRVQERIKRHRADYAEVHKQVFGYRPPAAEPPPELSGLPLDKALAAYERWAAQRTQTAWSDFFQVRDQERPDPEWGLELADALAGQPGKQLKLVDRLMDRAFDLDRRLPHLRPARPIRYCATLDEYAAPLVKHLGWPQRECDAALRKVQAGADDIPFLSKPAYDLHGVGTMVNGWLLARRRQCAPNKALDGDRDFLCRVLGWVAAVRWGPGYLRTYTTLGREICQAGLEHETLKLALGLPVGDRVPILRRAFFLCQTGWSEWIGRFAATQAGYLLQPHKQGRNRLADLAEVGRLAWEHVGPTLPGMDLTQGILNFFLQSAKTLGLTVSFWNRTADKIYHNIALGNWLARMLIWDLERRVGTYNLPYALLIAGHVRYGLADISLSALQDKVHEIRRNPDGRLVVLTMLPPDSAYNPNELAILAEHTLQLESPEAIRRPPRA